jgi:hypothetical protein
MNEEMKKCIWRDATGQLIEFVLPASQVKYQSFLDTIDQWRSEKNLQQHFFCNRTCFLIFKYLFFTEIIGLQTFSSPFIKKR